MDHPKNSEPTFIRHGDKQAVRFVTPSGVTAIVATCIDPVLVRLLRKKLERKLTSRRRTGAESA